MSEKREGWLGWMNEPTLVNRSGWVDNSDDGPHGAYKVPVWVAPLDPDGPKPGETWEHSYYGRVAILRPYQIDGDGSVIQWWAAKEGRGSLVLVATAKLSPIKPTRTVTVELTEEEVEAVKAMTSRYQDGDLLTESGKAIHKLAEALEDE